MKKTLNGALAVAVLIGLCGAARAELVCDDGGPGGKVAARKGCVAERARTSVPVTPKASVKAPESPARQGPGKAVPVSVISSIPVPPLPPTPQWEIKASDLSIYGAIKRWSDMNGWQVSWELGDDYPVTVVASFDDNFRGAVDAVLNAYRDADVAPKGCFYENKVLRIVRRIGDGRECDAKNK